MPEPYDSDHMKHTGFRFAPELASRTLPLDKGAWLFRQGQACRELFTVQVGIIRLLRPQRDGTEAIMHIAHPGEWVAESSLFSERYHCHAIAETDAVLIAVKKSELLSLLRRDPQRSLQLAQLFAQRLRELRLAHEVLRIRSAPQRVLAWLRLRATGHPPKLTVERTWTSIADELALSREALYRALASLRKSGAISMHDSVIELRHS